MLGNEIKPAKQPRSWPFGARMGRTALFLILAVFSLAANAQPILSENSAKYRVTREVFDRLTYVYANNRPQPVLEILARQSGKSPAIARYRPGNRSVIQLGEETYDVCSGLGPDSLDALAVLLSHELAHHYEKHDWYDTFGIGQTDDSAPAENIKRYEAEADFYGCFYGELAGFATGRVFPRLLDVLYERFTLAERLAGYPSKVERKEVYQKKQQEATQMAAVFKAGQFLYLLKEFEASARCFDYLINRFPSREILNNLAAAKLQQALQLHLQQTPPGFVYPVELDARSRLVSAHRNAPLLSGSQQLGQLLTEARQYADKARQMDPAYTPAYINLACAYSLQGNQAAAIGVINELGPSQLTGNAYSIRAIAYYQDKQVENAEKQFALARQQGAYMGAYNWALFEKLNQSLVGSLTSWIRGWFEQETPPTLAKGNKSGSETMMNQPASFSLPAQSIRLQVSEKPYLLLQWSTDRDLGQASIQVNSRKFRFWYTTPYYNDQTEQAIKIGQSRTAVLNQYGEPAYTLPGVAGEYWVYPRHKLVFEVSHKGQVTGWLVYARSI